MVAVSSSGGRRSVPAPRHFTFHYSHQNTFLRKHGVVTPILLLLLVLLSLCGIYFFFSGGWHDYPHLDNHDEILLLSTRNPRGSLASPSRWTYSQTPPVDNRVSQQYTQKENLNDNHEDVEAPVVIAHVVSLIKCTKETTVTGFLDAAAVLRHSIHKTSVHTRDPTTGQPVSKYSYQMYAIVHAEGCASQAPLLKRLGYKTLIRHNPVNRTDIIDETYRHFVQFENCCGIEEFIKLYAYTLLDHPIVVHWDMDVAVLQPLDELYDSMLLNRQSAEGQAARAKLHLSHPYQTLPDRIDAFYTKDVTSSQPWEIRQGIQGGFLISRPSMEMFQKYVDFITEGDYVRGRGNGFGWGGLGFGGFQGAMAYQGATAYMYDILHPGHGVALNPCRYNQVVADVLWRGPEKMEHHLQCRQYPHEEGFYTFVNNTPEFGACEDCRIMEVSKTKSVHFTACKKPWECRDPRPRRTNDKREVYRLENLTNRTTCHALFAKWFQLRQDFEKQMLIASMGRIKPSTHDGQYLSNAFLGYCKGPGKYIPMVPPSKDFNISKLYGV